MQALILAGGRGERFRPITDYIPKVMIPFKGKPIIEHNVQLCKSFGIKKIFILAGYKAEVIADYYKNDNIVTVVKEGMPRGTGGAIKPFIDFNGPLLIINGDSLYKVNLLDMISFHYEHKPQITIAIRKVNDVRSFGLVDILKHRVLRFMEKPKKKKVGYVNIGVYIISPGIRIPDDGFVSLEKDVFPVVAKSGELYGYKGREVDWCPIDNKERYDMALKRTMEWRIRKW